ncbi:MAG: ComEA family DNA-binding protein [Lachnospiraceae bacterium]|nr:ComEA family DNA-binding protein [Lachnospiraceae bacterium]
MREKRIRILMIAGLVAVVVFFLVKNGIERRTASFPDIGGTEDFRIEESVTKTTYFVYLSGAVLNPGVYEADPEERLFEVIDRSGGLSEDADTGMINLASRVKDGMHVHVPSFSDPGQASGKKVNVNTADADQLTTLPGIGKSKAEAIVKYRNEHGFFVSEEELIQVPGIGESVLENIREKITF